VFALRRTLPPDKQRILDRAALITGGSSGIGLAIARMLKDEGYELTLASRRPERVQAAAEELGAVAVAADSEMPTTANGWWPSIASGSDGSTCSSTPPGSVIGGRVEDLPVKHLDLQIAVNLRGLSW